MTEIEPDQISDEKARQAATSLARALLAPANLLKKGLSRQAEITIADTIRTGAVILGAVNEGYRDEILKTTNREFINALFESLYSPKAFEEFLYKRIKERKVTESQIDQAIAEAEELMSGPAGVHKVIRGALADVFPKSPRGRPSNFDPAVDPGRFLSASSEIENACKMFLQLRRSFPTKTTKDILGFIATENSRATTLMKKQASYISRVMLDSDLQAVKGEATKARRLADAISGESMFGWSWKYSVQRGQEFRRAKTSNPEE